MLNDKVDESYMSLISSPQPKDIKQKQMKHEKHNKYSFGMEHANRNTLNKNLQSCNQSHLDKMQHDIHQLQSKAK